MVKSNEIQKVILDTDVIINWLTQEVETATRILLGVSSSLKSATLISRDKQLLKIGSRLISTATPESLLRSQHTQK